MAPSSRSGAASLALALLGAALLAQVVCGQQWMHGPSTQRHVVQATAEHAARANARLLDGLAALAAEDDTDEAGDLPERDLAESLSADKDLSADGVTAEDVRPEGRELRALKEAGGCAEGERDAERGQGPRAEKGAGRSEQLRQAAHAGAQGNHVCVQARRRCRQGRVREIHKSAGERNDASKSHDSLCLDSITRRIVAACPPR